MAKIKLIRREKESPSAGIGTSGICVNGFAVG